MLPREPLDGMPSHSFGVIHNHDPVFPEHPTWRVALSPPDRKSIELSLPEMSSFAASAPTKQNVSRTPLEIIEDASI